MRHILYYPANRALETSLWTFYTLLTAFYICKTIQANSNESGIQNAIYCLSVAIILLFIHLSYRLYYKSIQKVQVLIDHYIDDIVQDKLKQIAYTETLNKDKINLFATGWIRENIPLLYIPSDIIQLCGLYLCHQRQHRHHLRNYRSYQSQGRKSSYSSVASLFFSFSYSSENEPLFYGQTVNRFTKEKLEKAVRKVMLSKIIGICLCLAVCLYWIRF